MVAVSLAYCTGRQGLRLLENPTATILRPLWAAGWWCLSLNRGAWDRASFSQTKAYAQSALSSTSNKSLKAASARVGYWAWWGCTHMVTGPKTFSYPVALLCTIKGIPCPTWASQHPPMPPPEKGCSVVPVWSLAHENLSSLDKSHVTPTSLLSPVPTSWCPQRGAWSHL